MYDIVHLYAIHIEINTYASWRLWRKMVNCVFYSSSDVTYVQLVSSGQADF